MQKHHSAHKYLRVQEIAWFNMWRRYGTAPLRTVHVLQGCMITVLHRPKLVVDTLFKTPKNAGFLGLIA
jgi:hypothetical protein